MNKTILEALNGASSFLAEHGREENVARLFLQHILQTNYSGLMMRMHDPITEEQQLQLDQYVAQHATGKPFQYITGVEEFYGRVFEVDESVLIPRPETEELVYGTIERMNKLFGAKVSVQLADIGTGSGAIAITMKSEWPEASVTATDLSEVALATAEKNAKRLNADVRFLLGDLAEPIAEQKWDVVLSNPPYIAFDEMVEMSEVVLEHEPHSALFAEEDGLILYRKLAIQLPAMMNRPALIGLEIGYKQGPAVAAFFGQAFPQAHVEIVKDINGKDRIVFCVIPE